MILAYYPEQFLLLILWQHWYCWIPWCCIRRNAIYCFQLLSFNLGLRKVVDNLLHPLFMGKITSFRSLNSSLNHFNDIRLDSAGIMLHSYWLGEDLWSVPFILEPWRWRTSLLITKPVLLHSKRAKAQKVSKYDLIYTPKLCSLFQLAMISKNYPQGATPRRRMTRNSDSLFRFRSSGWALFWNMLVREV